MGRMGQQPCLKITMCLITGAPGEIRTPTWFVASRSNSEKSSVFNELTIGAIL